MKKYVEVIQQGRWSGLTIFHNSIDLDWRKVDLGQSKKYCIYIVRILFNNRIIKYIGKGVIYFNKNGSISYKSRFLSHRNDALYKLMLEAGPDNCQIQTLENLTESEAKAMEAWFIQLIDGPTMHYGQYRWRGEQFLNKRCEDVNKDLINYFDLDTKNDVGSFRRKINNNC